MNNARQASPTDCHAARPRSAAPQEMKGEERMVCHFYRDSFPCKVRTLVGRRRLAPAPGPGGHALLRPCAVTLLSSAPAWHALPAIRWRAPCALLMPLCCNCLLSLLAMCSHTGHGQAPRHPDQEAPGDQVCESARGEGALPHRCSRLAGPVWQPAALGPVRGHLQPSPACTLWHLELSEPGPAEAGRAQSAQPRQRS